MARLNSEIKEKFTPDGRMGSVERVAQQLLVDRELKKIVEELREDSEDAENPICPPIEELKKFPCGSMKFHAFECGSIQRCLWAEKHCIEASH